MDGHEAALEILHREIRLVTADNGELCEKCGEMIDRTWRVKPGNLEHCAKLIAEQTAAELARLREENKEWQSAFEVEKGDHAEDVARLRAEVERLEMNINTRLNNCLCEMKPDYDDSIVGFNEAWDIVRAVFAEAKARAALAPAGKGGE